MTSTPEQSSPRASNPWLLWSGWPARLGILALLLTTAAVSAYYFYYPAQIGAAQPIAFSHRIHVTEKQISCLLCHPQAIRGPRAGIPPLATCMLCHTHIIIHHPQVAMLRRHYAERVPVEWVRVTYLPDLAHFNHQVHLRRGFDCSKCHGNVSAMDRVVQVHNLNMGFCIQCHRDWNASHDCYTCHY